MKNPILEPLLSINLKKRVQSILKNKIAFWFRFKRIKLLRRINSKFIKNLARTYLDRIFRKLKMDSSMQ